MVFRSGRDSGPNVNTGMTVEFKTNVGSRDMAWGVGQAPGTETPAQRRLSGKAVPQ
jgi:hypothetical protein